MPDRPNVLLVLTDQHRGDAVGADPNCPTDADDRPLVHTPNIDHLTEGGALCSRAYSPAPTCVPARRCLWSGQTPASCDATVSFGHPWDFEPSLPRVLRDHGYQTMLAGKTHSKPKRNHFGFEQIELHDALASSRPTEHPWGGTDDYTRWLEKRADGEFEENAHGLDRNSWDPRPWHLEEHLHPTNWSTTRAIEFLERRDPTRPFFLTLSYVRPHQPFDPPQAYWDMYIDRELPEPAVGDWVMEHCGDLLPEHPATDAWLADLPPTIVHRARAAYYASITHIDHQLHRFMEELKYHGELSNTLVLFTSDHGEMLGDHYHWRKGYGWEGSARVPMLVQLPESMRERYPSGQTLEQPVGLEDVLPTVLETVGIDVPDAVEGRSLLDLLAGDESDWRDLYHGEHRSTYVDRDATQYLVGRRFKYVWNPVTDEEFFFDLETDPLEERNLAEDPEYEGHVREFRDYLAEHLAGRSEGFSDGEELTTVDPSEVWS